MTETRWGGWRHFWALIVLGALTALAYGGSFRVPFQLDDQRAILNNPGLADRHNLHAVLTTNKSRPVLDVTYFLNLHLGGSEARSFHWINLFLHLSNVFLFYGLLHLLLREKRGRPMTLPWLAAGLWAVHPLGTEAVTYISGRAALLCALFVLACTAAHWCAGHSATRGGRLLFQLFAALSYAAAMLSYPLAVTWPLALLAIDHFLSRAQRPPRPFPWRLHGPYGLLLLGYAAYRLFWIGYFTLPVGARGFGENLLTQAVALVRGMALVLLPLGQNVDHDLPTVTSILELRFLLSLAVLAAVGFWAARRFWRGSLTGLSLILFAVAWLPLFLAPIEDPLAERRIYLGLPWAATALAAGGFALRERWPLSRLFQRAAVVLLLTLLAAMTALRNQVWQDELRLWSDAAAKSPEKWRPNYNLGNAYRRAGQLAPAAEAYRRAVKIDPRQVQSRNNLANLLVELGRPQEAIALLQPALAVREGGEIVRSSLANAHFHAGDLAAAEALYRQLSADYPQNPGLHYNLGNVLFARRRMGEAAQAYRRALELGLAPQLGQPALQKALAGEEKRR